MPYAADEDTIQLLYYDPERVSPGYIALSAYGDEIWTLNNGGQIVHSYSVRGSLNTVTPIGGGGYLGIGYGGPFHVGADGQKLIDTYAVSQQLSGFLHHDIIQTPWDTYISIEYRDVGAGIVDDVLIEFDGAGALLNELSLNTLVFGDPAGAVDLAFGNYTEDWLHSNSLDARDDGTVLVSLRNIDQIALIDWPSLSLAGMIGGPELSLQHAAKFDGDSIVVYNNNPRDPHSPTIQSGMARYDLNGTLLDYRDMPFFASVFGSAQMLTNGNWLVIDGPAGRIYEFSNDFHDKYLDIKYLKMDPIPFLSNANGGIYHDDILYRAWKIAEPALAGDLAPHTPAAEEVDGLALGDVREYYRTGGQYMMVMKNGAQFVVAVDRGADFTYVEKIQIDGAAYTLPTSNLGDGGDNLLTASGHTIAYGYQGNDLLFASNQGAALDGGAGHDVLVSAAGNDILTGGGSDDTYVFRRAFGQDVIDEARHGNLPSGSDGIILECYSASAAALSRAGQDLIIDMGAGAGITIKGQFAATGAAIELLTGQDGLGYALGVTWSGTAAADLMCADIGPTSSLSGFGGSDILFAAPVGSILRGGNGDDTLHGREGNDRLFGWTGDDTYVFTGGDDVINETQAAYPLTGAEPVEAPGADTLVVAAAWDIITLAADRMGEDLFVRFGNTGSVTIARHYTPAGPVERVLVDGVPYEIATRWAGTAGRDFMVADDGPTSSLVGYEEDDVLFASSVGSVLRGGAGDDVLMAAEGDDIFVFRPVDPGRDTIYGFDVETDRIDCNYFGLRLQEILARAAEVEGGVAVDFAPNAGVRLVGLDLTDLSGDLFLM